MEFVQFIPDEESVEVVLNDLMKETLVCNARYFKCNILPALRNVLLEPYDIVSWFEHEDGIKYGIVHTISGCDNPELEFAKKINEGRWEVCVSHFKYKKSCIKEYLSSIGCNQNVVFCMFDAD